MATALLGQFSILTEFSLIYPPFLEKYFFLFFPKIFIKYLGFLKAYRLQLKAFKTAEEIEHAYANVNLHPGDLNTVPNWWQLL